MTGFYDVSYLGKAKYRTLGHLSLLLVTKIDHFWILSPMENVKTLALLCLKLYSLDNIKFWEIAFLSEGLDEFRQQEFNKSNFFSKVLFTLTDGPS